MYNISYCFKYGVYLLIIIDCLSVVCDGSTYLYILNYFGINYAYIMCNKNKYLYPI